MNHTHSVRRRAFDGWRGKVVVAVGAAALLAACAPSSTPQASQDEPPAEDPVVPVGDEDFDLDDLIAAAQEEGELTVYDGTGKIEQMAAEFQEKYGITTAGIKVDSAEMAEKMTREAQAGNVTADVAALSDVPAVSEQLVPQGIVENWVPPDLAGLIPETMHDPLIVITDPSLYAYNTEKHDTCPVSNVWALTDEELLGDGGFVMQDPLGKPDYADWWNQLSVHGDDLMRQAYEDLYGEPLETSEQSATHEWIKRLAESGPLLTKSSEEASEAVGAQGQSNPPMGLMSSAKFRNNDDKGYVLGVCDEIEPWVGFAKPKAIVMASGTSNPNAAKLFIHYAMTAEGIKPQVDDGKLSANSEVPPSDEDPSNAAELTDRIFFFDNATAAEDWANRQNMHDFWRVNRR
ncbi:ABC transporter substrate-binding protein [Phytoactinopolyspora mesophila]|uniref:Extracellular solute-binding protein n=1 Tax=Phytoactinopolyspora mesophila TaxID=2650750 RepID=A0A7K3M8G3_9ACTN|nr:ABC transporter substrate-binding protein [Phytoactinopolyspora mesophila]NDL58708.1 extracellular solute-binding protein [Phytoactinopolyspora mesophila]